MVPLSFLPTLPPRPMRFRPSDFQAFDHPTPGRSRRVADPIGREHWKWQPAGRRLFDRKLDEPLVARLKSDAPMNEADRATFFGGASQGYTDYPALAASI